MFEGVATRLPVTFHGEGSGEGELTWGQREIWHTMRRTGRTLNIGGVLALPPSATVAEYAGLLEYLVGRHQALRTRFVLDAGGDPVRQVVDATGTVHLDLVDGPTEAEAEALRGRYEFTPFDLEREYPIRMGVVVRDGAPSHLVVQYSHLAVDGFGIDAIVRDLAHRGAEHPPPPSGLAPLELAARQHSPAGRKQSAKSIRYWRSLLADVPPARLPGSDDPRTPRFRELVCRSPALHLALRAIAARTRAETGHALLAAYAVALARVTGIRPVVAQVLVSNRFRPDCADAVCHLTQPGLVVVDPGPGAAPVPFDELVARVWKSATAAYLHGYYDPAEHRAMLDGLAAERGATIDLSCFVNDRRGPSAPGPAPDGAQARAALPRTTVRWERELPTYDGRLYLQVDAAEDAVQLGIWADTHAIAPAAVERFARELEAVAVTAA
ncbi:condensation domain-containing protein [Dactylosporangium sp. NPDC048998]|uniref:condensation domain-containing protein n=1 Tax=Dactylosporangium sp. NPDC048998 TaxID=3363976 RepID=UPI00371A59C3